MLRTNRPIKTPWLARAAKWQIVAAAMLCGVLVWLALLATDFIGIVVHGELGGLLAMGTLDAVVAILVGLLVLRALMSIRARHQRLLNNLHTIADLNHHIRNALVQIQLAARLSDHDQSVVHVREASSRIEWALRELLPSSREED